MDSAAYKIHEFVAHATEVNCLTFGPKSHQVLATGGEDTKVNVWRVGSASNLWTLGQNKSPIESVCFDAEEQYVVSGARNGSIKVFDLNAGRLARNLGGHQVNTCSLQYHPDGEFIVSGSSDSSVKVWDVRNKTCIQTYTGHNKEITCVRFSPDGRWVASTSKDGKLLMWDLVADKLLHSVKMDASAYLTSFEFNPSELVVAAVTSTRSVRLWDLETFETFRQTPPDTSPIKAMAISSDGESIYTATKDNLRAFNWNPSMKLKGAVDIAWDKVAELRISNDGTTLTAGSYLSNFVSLWSIDVTNLVCIDSQKRSSPSRVAESKRSVPVSGFSSPSGSNANEAVKDVPTNSHRSSSHSHHPHQRSEEKEYHEPTTKIPSPASSSSSNNYNPSNNHHHHHHNVSPAHQAATKEEAENHHLRPPIRPGFLNLLDNNRKGWGSEDAKKDMATSMGDSFRKRFEEEQQQVIEHMRREDQNSHKKTDDDDDNDSHYEINHHRRHAVGGGGGSGNRPVNVTTQGTHTDLEQISMDVEELERLLPPSRYPPTNTNGTHARGSNGDGGSVTSLSHVHNNNNNGNNNQGNSSPSRGAQGQGQGQGQGCSSPLRYSSPVRTSGGSGSKDRKPERAVSIPPLRSVPLPLVSGMAGMEIVGIGKNGNVAAQEAKSVYGSSNTPSSSNITRPDSRSGRGSSSSHAGAGGSGSKDVGKDKEDGQSAILRAAAKRVALASAGGQGQGVGGVSPGQGLRGSPNQGLARGLALASAPNIRLDMGGGNVVSNGGNGNVGGSPPASHPYSRNEQKAEENNHHTEMEMLLDRMVHESGSVAVGLSQRLTSLRLLRKMWGKGDLIDVIDYIQTLSHGAAHDSTQLILLADFFSTIELRGGVNILSLTLDACVGFMVALDTILIANERSTSGVVSVNNSLALTPISSHVLCAIFKSFTELCQSFGELIRSTRALSVGSNPRGNISPTRQSNHGHVDLSRDERIRKCNTCHAILERLKRRLEGIYQQAQRKNDVKLLNCINRLQPLVEAVVPF